SDGQTLLSQAKSEATKAHNYQIVGCMSLVPSDFSILSLRELDETAGSRKHRQRSRLTPQAASLAGVPRPPAATP
ncbi:hypothetical protein, partial [Faecalicatena contorta]|uniref:hypothetical protein n=1 Tax=Faecalicatena contorta TaxID=39482 RepID=UPI003217ABA7